MGDRLSHQLRLGRFSIFDAKGLPEHERGVTPVPELYFLGLPWQYTWGSGRLCGVGRDATYLGKRVAEAVARVERAALGPGLMPQA